MFMVSECWWPFVVVIYDPALSNTDTVLTIM